MLIARTLVPVALVVLVSACREQPTAAVEPAPVSPAPSALAPATRSAARHSASWTRVAASSHVCMVNDQDMGRDQIPVTVEGRTYFGCCANCKGKLENDVSARTASDPVTRKPVDKATAVIARNEAGKVLYFESEATLAAYVQ